MIPCLNSGSLILCLIMIGLCCIYKFSCLIMIFLVIEGVALDLENKLFIVFIDGSSFCISLSLNFSGKFCAVC